MTLRVLSLGAGVQSSCLALMFARGEFDYMPDVAIFADTMGEPEAVYDWLGKLETMLPFPVERVSAGNLKEDVLRGIETGSRVATPPLFVDGEDVARPLNRQCTREYKVDIITKAIRRLSGAVARSRMAAGSVERLFGISLDEVQRMRDSPERWAVNVYPLIDKRMSRTDCVNWLTRNGYPVPMKSACSFCPYRSDASWRDMRDNRPQEWRGVVEFDAAIRRGIPGVKNAAYLHRSLVPLDEVDLRTAEDMGQANFFNNECEGMCGV